MKNAQKGKKTMLESMTIPQPSSNCTCLFPWGSPFRDRSQWMCLLESADRRFTGCTRILRRQRHEKPCRYSVFHLTSDVSAQFIQVDMGLGVLSRVAGAWPCKSWVRVWRRRST